MNEAARTSADDARFGAWAEPLSAVRATPSFAALTAFVAEERARGTVYPAAEDELRALRTTAPADTRLVLLGQDPYHGPGQADGLAFSVRPAMRRLPPSLKNLFRELVDDLRVAPPTTGDLGPWAARGVLLLNTTLTVRESEPLSHAKRGWEAFTDEVLRTVAAGPPAVFLLLGAHAQKKAPLIDTTRHRIVAGVHPSPLSASKGFFGSKPFSAVNAALVELGRAPIDFTLPLIRKSPARSLETSGSVGISENVCRDAISLLVQVPRRSPSRRCSSRRAARARRARWVKS